MMDARKPSSPACLIPLAGLLVLAAVFANARPALAQTEDACPPPPGVTLPEKPSVTAQQVEEGSATLKEFRAGHEGTICHAAPDG